MSQLLVGIDIAKNKNVAAFLDQDGNLVSDTLSFLNNLSGANILKLHILELATSLKPDNILIGLEPTSVYDWHLFNFLKLDSDLASCQVFRLNPRTVKKFKDIYNELDKSDPIDAAAIAERLRFGRLPDNTSVDPKYLSLQRLTRFRLHLVENIAREKTSFLNNLFLKFSNYKLDCPFSDLFGATSMAVITDLSAEDISQMPLESLVDFVVKHGKNRFADPQETAQALKKAARDAYRLDKTVAESIDLILGLSINSIKFLQRQIDDVNKAISLQMKGLPNTLTSVPGIGEVFAAGIIAEIGNIKRFHSSGNLARFAGLTWKKTQSGEFEASDTRLVKAGDSYLRYYLVQAAYSLVYHNPEYRAYYQKKFKEVSRYQHKRALVMSARKLVNLVFTLLDRGVIYKAPIA